MAISIRNPRVEELAREIGRMENRSMTEVIIEALEEKREKALRHDAAAELKLTKLREIADCFSELPVTDQRSADDILGYNDDGGF